MFSAQSKTRDHIRAEGDFKKRYYTVERTSKIEISPDEQSEKSCRENLVNEIQLTGP